MATKPPGDLSHLERLIQQWAHETDEKSTGRLRNVVGVTVIAQMLDDVRDKEGRHLFVFKGGAGLQMRYGLQARATKDLDTAYRSDMDVMVSEVTDAVEAGWSGFNGEVTNIETIERAQISPPPTRMKVKLRYKGKPFMTMPLEVSPAEAGSIDDPELVPVALTLETVQLDSPDELPFLPLRYQIAQKLHACSEPSTDDFSNDRARDLADLDLIQELSVEPEHLPEIREACVEIFEHRGKHAWPPTIVAGPDWNVIWENLAAKNGLEMTLDEALDAANEFTTRIHTAR